MNFKDVCQNVILDKRARQNCPRVGYKILVKTYKIGIISNNAEAKELKKKLD